MPIESPFFSLSLKLHAEHVPRLAGVARNGATTRTENRPGSLQILFRQTRQVYPLGAGRPHGRKNNAKDGDEGVRVEDVKVVDKPVTVPDGHAVAKGKNELGEREEGGKDIV
jgi:hypothetical protein